MVVTNGAYKLMRDWADDPIVREYSLSSDWDDRWRTGGSVDEVIEEAHLDSAHILAADRTVRPRAAGTAAPAARAAGRGGGEVNPASLRLLRWPPDTRKFRATGPFGRVGGSRR